jgi:predicted dehydrogenase
MTYRAGIVGTGGVAGMGIYDGSEDDIGDDPVDASHAGGYAAVDDVELVAIADVDEEALDRFGRAWGIPGDARYLDHEAMFEAADLDVVSVCTPGMFHREHVEDAARIGGVDAVWCEKPIACSVADAEAMVEVCEAAGVDLVVNHSQRFYRQHQRLREAVADGLIGDVRSVSAGSSMELLRVGTHAVDFVRYVLDRRADLVSGYVTGERQTTDLAGREVDDAGAGGYVVLEDGTFVTFDGTPRRDVGDLHYRFNGTDGRFVNDDAGWRYVDASGTEREPPAGGFDDGHEDSFENAVAHVVDLLDGDVEAVSSGGDAVRTLEVLVGFYASHYTGGRVSLPLDRPLKDVTVTSW